MEKETPETPTPETSPAPCNCGQPLSFPIVALITLAALVVGGGTGYYFGNKSSVQTQTQNQAQIQVQENQPTPSATATSQPETASDDDTYFLPVDSKNKNSNLQACYILDAYIENGKNYILADYIQWLSGEAGNTAAFEDGICPREIYNEGGCMPNGYHIRNKSHNTATIEVSENAKITVFNQKLTTEEVSFQKFAQEYLDNSPMDVYLIEQDTNGVITLIQNQYRP